MVRPLILAVDSDPQILRADSSETTLDIPGKLERDRIILDSRQGETCFIGRLPEESRIIEEG